MPTWFRRMRYPLAMLALGMGVLLVAALATRLEEGGAFLEGRYIQHEQATRLSDLSGEDQAAASSLATDAEAFATHLPLVSIETGGQEVPGRIVSASQAAQAEAQGTRLQARDPEDEDGTTNYVTLAADGRDTIQTTFSVYDSGTVNRLSDAPVLATKAELRVRGHSSRYFDKASYQVHLTEDDRTTPRQEDVLGMGTDNEWILNGPFLDKTLLRNYLSLNVAGELDVDSPDVRLCEVFVDGEYEGVYLLMESVSYGKSRVNVHESDSRYAETSYIVKRDWEDRTSPDRFEDILYGTRTTEDRLEVSYPTSQSLTDEQRAWIASDFNAVERILYSYDYNSTGYGYWRYVDTDSFVDYQIVNEMSYNADAGRYSTYYYKTLGGRLRVGPVWDFNNAYGNDIDVEYGVGGYVMVYKPLFIMLNRDPDYTERVISRYRALREGVLSDESLSSFVDAAVDYLGPAVERNYERWGYSFDVTKVDANNKLSPDERNPTSYEEAVEQLKEFIVERGRWLDDNIEGLRQFSAESATKQYNED